ncbi:IS481 family transposase [candidate division KSB1 bacterium]
MTQEQRDIKRKLRALKHFEETGSVSKTSRYFGISRQSFYSWKKAYEELGEKGLVNSKPCPKNPALRTPAHIEEKVLYLRRTYHLGPERITMYLDRYHGIKISESTSYRILKRHGISKLPQNTKKRTVLTHRYEKQVPGHHIQVDVKFLTFHRPDGDRVRRFQYTAIDDATRIRALKIYERHTQQNAINFIDYIVSKFPFRIHTVRTDNGHEFQAKFHWHLHDIGIRHVYIKPRTPRLNGKVERSHRTDQQEFYQLLNYKGDVDLKNKLEEWENFYNFHRPHGGLNGMTPYEVLKYKMNDDSICKVK